MTAIPEVMQVLKTRSGALSADLLLREIESLREIPARETIGGVMPGFGLHAVVKPAPARARRRFSTI